MLCRAIGMNNHLCMSDGLYLLRRHCLGQQLENKLKSETTYKEPKTNTNITENFFPERRFRFLNSRTGSRIITISSNILNAAAAYIRAIELIHLPLTFVSQIADWGTHCRATAIVNAAVRQTSHPKHILVIRRKCLSGKIHKNRRRIEAFVICRTRR